MEKILRHQLDAPPSLHQLCPDTPPQLSAIVARLMAKDPDQRFESAGELADALTPFAVANEPTTAPEIAIPTQASQFPIPSFHDPVQPPTPNRITPASTIEYETAITLQDRWRPGRNYVAFTLAAITLFAGFALLAVVLIVAAPWQRAAPGDDATSRAESKNNANSTASSGIWEADSMLPALRESQVYSLSLSADGSRLAAGSGYAEKDAASRRGEIQVFNMSNRQRFAFYPQLPGPARGVCLSPNGETVAAGIGDYDVQMPGEVHIWDLGKKQLNRSFVAHDNGTFTLAFHPARPLLATGGWDSGRSVKLWDLSQPAGKDYQPAFTLAGHGPKVNCLAFSHNGNQLAAGSDDGNIHMWDLAASPPRATVLRGFRGSVLALAFLPDERFVFACTGADSGEPQVGKFDLATGVLSLVADANDNNFFALAIRSKDGPLLTGNQDGRVRVWDLHGGKEIQAFRHGSVCWALALHAENQILVSAGGWEQPIRIWSLKK